MPEISAIRIESFRGVPNRLDVDFRPRPESRPSSLLLYGENGSGKSTLADSLEFVLRASLLRRIDPERPVKRHARSFASEESLYVEIEYDTGDRVGRGNPKHDPFGKRFDDGVRKVEEPEPDFSVAPLVLRRADIVGFWNLDDDERKLAFFDYFRKPGHETSAGVEAVQTVEVLEEQIRTTSRQKTVALRRMSDASGISADRIPKDPAQHRQYRRRVLVRDFARPNHMGGINGLAPEVSRAWDDFVKTSTDLARAERNLRLKSEVVHEKAADRVVNEIQEILDTAEGLVTETFLEVSSARDFVSGIRFTSEPDSNRLEIRLELKSGKDADPLAVLSEANLDLLAFLIFCAVIEASAEHGQSKVLVLDDVFQSVDSGYRQKACQQVVTRFFDWQLLITTHDKLWFAVLADAFQGRGKAAITREVARWTFDGGPVIREAQLDPSAALRRAMGEIDAVAVCSHSGLLLEEIADRLSWTLGASVVRRRGDRYTLGDLWPSVAKKLKKTNASGVAKEVSESMVYRNLVGAHFNEWARTVVNSEAELFGEATLSMYDLVHCSGCGQWVKATHQSKTVATCGCGRLSLEQA